MTELTHIRPDRMISVREVFGIDTELQVPAFSETEARSPASVTDTASSRMETPPAFSKHAICAATSLRGST